MKASIIELTWTFEVFLKSSKNYVNLILDGFLTRKHPSQITELQCNILKPLEIVGIGMCVFVQRHVIGHSLAQRLAARCNHM